jgi:hypothetical protein
MTRRGRRRMKGWRGQLTGGDGETEEEEEAGGAG